MASWTFDSASPEETHAMGRALGQAIGADGLVIALVGPLGAGKTVFVKGLAEGLGVPPRAVSSPTFVIAQQYAVPKGPETLHHVDLYRLEDPEELEAIGFYDMFSAGAVLAVEWADRFPGVLGPDYLEITFEGPDVGEGASRGSRVAVKGPEDGLAARIASDWFEGAERIGRARAGASGSGRATHGLLAWLIAAVVCGSVVAESRHAADSNQFASDCSEFEAVVPAADHASPLPGPLADDFGTLRIRCAPSSDHAGNLGSAKGAKGAAGIDGIEGVARLLIGRHMDPNEATPAMLKSLPGVGPGRADAIIRSRSEAPFLVVSDLERVIGIGPATRAKLEPWLRVESGQRRRDG